MGILTTQRIFRSLKNWNKCFCIGANKTGTSSLQAIIQTVLEFKANQGLVEEYAAVQAIKGNYLPLKKVMEDYDFHKDIPASQGETYVALDALFPNSKFILTTRKTSEWVRSFLNFYAEYLISCALKNDKWLQKGKSMYPGYGSYWINHYWQEEVLHTRYLLSTAKEDDLDSMREIITTDMNITKMIGSKFERRNNNIKNYFRGRKKDLLVIDISKEKGIQKLLEFLELPNIAGCEWPKIQPSKENKEKDNGKIDIRLRSMRHDELIDSKNGSFISRYYQVIKGYQQNRIIRYFTQQRIIKVWRCT